MAEFIEHTNCEACGSSDANAIYADGSTYCFSCQVSTQDPDVEQFFEESPGFVEVPAASFVIPTDVRGFRDRGIKTAISEFFDVTVKLQDGEISHHYYPYFKDGSIVGAKVRTVKSKQFMAIGDKKGAELFGMSKFNPGGRKVVITEGELDTMAVAQAFMDKYNKVFPVVSLPDGAQSAKKACLQHRDWLRSFDEVILMFDMDEPGIEATQIASKIIGADKVKLAVLTAKDPCDAYLQGGSAVILNAVWNAQPWQPAGIINAADTWEEYLLEKDAIYQTFPDFLPDLNRKIHGVRAGSITMLTSGTGCGKTTFVKEFLYNILRATEHHIGLVSLEESTSETVRGFLSLDLNKRIGLPGVDSTVEEEKAAFDRILGTGRVQLLDHAGSVQDASLVDKLEFLALTGCRFIVLDHITVAVSESINENVNAAIDSLMSSLLKIVKRHDVHITVISHLRKVGGGAKSFEAGGKIEMDDLKGSGSLKQISSQVIALSRDLSADSALERNTVRVNVLKDRYTGATGHAGSYIFNETTGRLEEAMAPELADFKKED